MELILDRKVIKRRRNEPRLFEFAPPKRVKLKRKRRTKVLKSSKIPKIEHTEEKTDENCRICNSYWVKNRWHLDTDWLSCDACADWFHVHCLGMGQEKFKSIVNNKEKFLCAKCCALASKRQADKKSGQLPQQNVDALEF